MDKAKEAEGSNEEHHIENEVINAIAPGLPSVSMIPMVSTTFTEPTTAAFLTQQYEDQLFHQLAPIVGTPGADFSYNPTGFMI